MPWPCPPPRPFPDRARSISSTRETATTTSSSLSIFDASTGTDKVVIANGPGATTSIAVNPKNNSVYVGVGYGPDVGNIYSFSLSQIDSAYKSGTPIDFLSGGVLFNSNGTGSQIGAGMFFDKQRLSVLRGIRDYGLSA